MENKNELWKIKMKYLQKGYFIYIFIKKFQSKYYKTEICRFLSLVSQTFKKIFENKL